MAATPGELMNKATGANRGDQRRGSAPSQADHGAGAEMISRGRTAKQSTTVDLMAVQTCAALRNSMCDQKPRLRKFARLAAICRDAGASGASGRKGP
jgi:hypothetical protein